MKDDLRQGTARSTSTDRPIVRLVGRSAIYGLGAVLVQLIAIVLMPFLTAHLSPREFGAIAVLNLASLSLLAVLSLGLSSSIGLCYFDYRRNSQRETLIWSAIGVVILSAVVMSLITLSTASTWSRMLLGTDEFKDAASYMVLATAATIVVLPMDAKLRLDERPRAFVFASLITTVAIGVLTLSAVISLQLGVRGYFLALFLGRLISLFTFYVLAMRETPVSFSMAMVKPLLALGLPFVPQFAFLYILQYGNVEGTKRLIGLDAAGIYSAGLTIGLGINVIISSISNAWTPFFLSYTGKRDEAVKLFGDVTAYYIFGVGCVTLCFYYLAMPLTMLLSSPEYALAHDVVGLTATAMYVLGAYNLLLPPSYFAKDTGKLTRILGVATAIHLAIGYLLIPLYGIMGAAWSLVVAYGILDLLLYLRNTRQGSKYFRIQYEWPRLLVFLSAYLISIVSLTQLDISSGLDYVILCISHFSLMLTLTYLLLRRDEKAEIKRCLTQLRCWLRPRPYSGQKF